jgi:predicted nucleic acid-binding protein
MAKPQLKQPAIFSTAHTAVLMREHGIRRKCTRDMDFNQFAFLEVIDPIRL